MIYQWLDTIILRGTYTKEVLMNKIDMFALAERITQEQYNTLVSLMETENNEIN